MGFMQKKLDILTRNVDIALCFVFFGNTTYSLDLLKTICIKIICVSNTYQYIIDFQKKHAWVYNYITQFISKAIMPSNVKLKKAHK